VARSPRRPTPRECSIARALDVVGDKWSLLVVRELTYGVHRFDGIASRTGASRDVLTDRLRRLESAGIIERRRYSEHPPRDEYHLTEAGGDLREVLLTLLHWGDRHRSPTPPVVWRHDCGAVLTPVVACAHCGRPAAAEQGSLTLEPEPARV
jgi:DNA-binding HxlR family transcriptional regulator